MFSKTNIVATIVNAIWAFMGGYLLWGIIADPYLSAQTRTPGLMRETPDFMWLAIGCLIMAFAFSTIYSKWARGAHSISQGLQFGVWIGILKGLGSGIIDYSTGNILGLKGTAVNALVYILFFAIMGALASMIYNKIKSAEE